MQNGLVIKLVDAINISNVVQPRDGVWGTSVFVLSGALSFGKISRKEISASSTALDLFPKAPVKNELNL